MLEKDPYVLMAPPQLSCKCHGGVGVLVQDMFSSCSGGNEMQSSFLG